MQTDELTVNQASTNLNNATQILTQLKSERDKLKRKIEEATRNDEIDLLSELRDRIFEIEEMELPFAELFALEAAVEYWQAAMLTAQQRERERRANFDAACNERERSIAELRELIHDQSGKVSESQLLYLNSQHEIQETSKQLSLYQQRLRELQSQSEKTEIRQAQLGPFNGSTLLHGLDGPINQQ